MSEIYNALSMNAEELEILLMIFTHEPLNFKVALRISELLDYKSSQEFMCKLPFIQLYLSTESMKLSPHQTLIIRKLALILIESNQTDILQTFPDRDPFVYLYKTECLLKLFQTESTPHSEILDALESIIKRFKDLLTRIELVGEEEIKMNRKRKHGLDVTVIELINLYTVSECDLDEHQIKLIQVYQVLFNLTFRLDVSKDVLLY